MKRVLFIFVCLISLNSYAAIITDAEPANLDMFTMGMGLFGGLALFLYGMEMMSAALKAAAGNRMKDFLSKLTKNRITAALTGAFVTAVIQSSSVTTVLVVGFVSAGLMTMGQSIGVIMGANIGTTVTAQIVAFKVDELALLMIAIGFGMTFLSRQKQFKHYGNLLMGLGLVFFGMGIMSDGMEPLRTYQPFMDLMAGMERPLFGIIVAAAFTALVQSSSATTAIVIVMASQGFISLPAGIALAFGANVGTCITAILASIGKPVEAKRAAAVHIFFNVAGVLLWLFLIPELARFVSWFSPAHTALSGTERMAADVPRQIANAHTIFNVANTLIFICFVPQIGRMVEWLVPDRSKREARIVDTKYLDDELIDHPSLALDLVRLELGHLGDIIKTMLHRVRQAFLNNKSEDFDSVAKLDDKVDLLHADILLYLNKLMQQPLTEEQNAHLICYLRAAEDMERIGDVVETNLVLAGHQAIHDGISVGDASHIVMRELFEKTSEGLNKSIRAVVDNDELSAQSVIHLKPEMNKLIEKVMEIQSERVILSNNIALKVTRLENEIIDDMKRVYSLSKRIARLRFPSRIQADNS